MIAEFLNRDVIVNELKLLREDVEVRMERAKRRGDPIEEGTQELLDDLVAAEKREANESSGQPGFENPHATRRGSEPAPLDDYAFFSRDPVVSCLQSALQEFVDEHPDLVEDNPPDDDARRGAANDVMVTDRRLVDAPTPRHEDGRRIFDQFSITDARWVKSKVAEGIRLFRGKHAFNDTPAKAVELSGNARLVLVGDWGSGLPRARKVAEQIRKVLEEGFDKRQQHVVHLGDTYYSGWESEYRKRFLPYWPVRPIEANRVGSWCVNSNHDMYSGAYGFFDTLLNDNRFAAQQKSSYFNFIHPDWNIAALDTAWDEGRLHGSQLDWLSDLHADRKRKTLLLSHHQLFSAYESDSEKLAEQMAPLLEKKSVTAWFWGHEHRCVFYKPHANVQFGRCIGHGGVPVYMWRDEKDGYKDPASYEYRKSIPSGLEKWALFGFAVLDFDGPKIDVRYIDEDGNQHFSETIV